MFKRVSPDEVASFERCFADEDSTRYYIENTNDCGTSTRIVRSEEDEDVETLAEQKLYSKLKLAEHSKQFIPDDGLISSVAWNPECIKDGETGNILLGTSQGAIIETVINSNGATAFVKEHTASFGGEKNLGISSLYLYLINDDNAKAAKWLMLVCQPGRLYSACASIDMTPPSKSSYMSAANLQTGWITIPEISPHIFHPFFSTKDSQQTCLSMQNTNSLQQTSVVSALLLYPPHGEPNRFLWVGPSGITTGKDMGNAVGLVSDPTSEFHWLYTSHITMKYKPVDENSFTAAAEILAQSTESFEAVVLKFMSTDEPHRLGLKTLLEKKLDSMTRPEDRIRRDVLIIWLLEVHLAELAEARRDGREQESNELADTVVVNKDAVYNIMASHADIDSQLFIAKHIGDCEKIIDIHLMREHYMEALETLKNQAASALKYLEWAVSEQRNSDDVELHNLLILLYAQFRPKRLHEYLLKCGVDKAAIPYDLDFAMRTSEQYKLDKSTVHLLCVSELFNEAVELALKRFDEDGIELAKECAHMMDPDEDDSVMGLEPMYSVEQRRRIWLKIAAFVIERNGNAGECIGLLKESGDVISIQDILPFFPEFTKIEDFKDPLCECLKEHSVKIQELQQAMNDATLTAKEIREKTQRLRNRVTVIKAGDLCARCDRSLIGKPFYAHTCRHFFHRECLEDAMMPYLNEVLKARLSDLVAVERRLLSQLQAADLVSPASDNFYAEKEARFEKVSNAINEILGSDCPLCGVNAIELIDKPFFTDEEFLADRDSWQID
uniref:Vacuolar protein sorting-associated protein 18 homolog n=1 Tax=Angiostrongylus cantonensis TaxID=6313 RepID=A0A0K0DMH5_ANGCA